MEDEADAAAPISQAIRHAVVAGACWTAARLDTQSTTVWERIAQAQHQRASESLEKIEGQGSGETD